jgi:superfamily II DNA/RNA helicase
MDQSARMKTLAGFRNNEITYLIASDVAARGLDIPEVSHVFNFDVPTHAEDYVHRIGRTGRAGREGQAFTLVTKEEAKYLKAIEALIGKDIPWFDVGGLDVAEDETVETRAPRERKPRREPKPRGEGRTKQAAKAAEPAAEVEVIEAAEAPALKAREPRPAREARPPRQEQPKAAPRSEQPKAAPRSEQQPRAERSPRPSREPSPSRHPQRDVGDAPNDHGFHEGNMPAFLMRSVKVG